MDPQWARLADHAGRHHATITWPAARALDIPGQTLATWHERGRLHRPAPGVYVIAGSPPTWHQRVAVATGSGAAWASHRTAAALRGLDGFPERLVEVVTEHGRRRKRRAWTVHESRTLRGVDLDEVDGIPCTSVARTVLDLPAVAPARLVALALDHACRRWPGTLDVVTQRHLELPRRGRRGTRLVTEMLDERHGRGRFTDSGFETATVRLVRAVGLPEPVLQHRVRDGDFVAFIDLAWPDIRWALECDSLAFHSGKQAHEWDRARRRRLKRLGWETVEVTYDQVVKHARRTGEELRELYHLRRQAVLSSLGPDIPTGGRQYVSRSSPRPR
jgi:very-short-patch-repair endonuclease